MTNLRIPFNRPSIQGNEQVYMAEALANHHLSGDGVFTRRCQGLLEAQLSARKALLTTSCTHALEMAALLLDIHPGDEVIVPAFTFVSTVNAFVLRGARPVFIDIRPDTLNMDETHLEELITPNTKAIVVVHYAGVACEMGLIMDIANKYRIAVVEDNAHGLFGQYKDRNLGTFGSFATLSFHETKNFTCGEGGALLINDESYLDRAEIVREKGTDRSRFYRGQVDKYSWVDIGSSYLPSELLAAFLLGQLEMHESIQAKRRKIWEHYSERLKEWSQAQNVRLPIVPDYCNQSYHMFYLLFPSLELRQAAIEHLKLYGVLSVFHYLPLHLSIMGQQWGYGIGNCPITEQISDRLLRLPFYNDLSRQDQDFVIDRLQEITC